MYNAYKYIYINKYKRVIVLIAFGMPKSFNGPNNNVHNIINT